MRIWYAYLISFAALTESCRLLSDPRNSGQMFFPEFVLAVYLCRWRLTGNALPLVLPEHLANRVSCLVDVMVQVLPLRRTPVHVMSTAESSMPQEANPLELGLRNPAAARLIIFFKVEWLCNRDKAEKKPLDNMLSSKKCFVHQLLKWVLSDILDMYWEHLPARDAAVFGPSASFFKKKNLQV